MAKVSLRAYNREIEAMIDRGHLDEAIAHCQHILKTFPKHLETYRLLGKAYLEAKRHNEAVDIFSRVLVAEPSDFVSQVGMSIIRDEQGKFDDAIWHMERAFETQPSNAAIQGELQRLYGRRDGIQPPRIRMTRGALAHMYMQGELYPQAISETKGVLEEDPGRSDMQALLAKAYFKSGQKNDAADAASVVLKRYPYCLDANRVLTEILGSDRPESAEVYRRRVYELDPYAAQVNGSVFQSKEVSDAAVTLEQLDWNGQPAGMPSDWGGTSAISLEGGSSDEQPDWLKNPLPETTLTPPSSSAFVSEQQESSMPEADSPAQSAENIPDFLRAAGWGESTGAFDESKSSAMFDDEPESEAQTIEQGDMPDWVKAMAPPQETSETADEEEIPDWINKIGTGDLPVPNLDSSSEDQPDWLSGMDESSSTPEAQFTADEFDITDQSGGEMESPPSSQPAEDFDFLNSLKSDEPEPIADSSEERSDMPDDSGNLGMGEQEQDDSFAWLENLAAKQGATEGLLTDPSERLEEEPDWIKQAKGLSESPNQSTSKKMDPEPITEPLSESASANVEDLGKSEEERDDSFSWLENLAAKQGATEGLLTDPEERREEEPEWVKQAKLSAASQLPSDQEAVEETPEPIAEPAMDREDLEKSDEDRDDSFSWLENLAAKSDEAEEQNEDEPEWMDQAKDSTDLQTSAESEPTAVEDTDSMDGTGEDKEKIIEESMEISELEVEVSTESDVPVDDVASWLEGLDEEVATETAAVSTDDDADSWLKMLEESEAEQSPISTPSDDEDMTAWMEGGKGDAPVAESDVPESEAAEMSDELPGWLSGLEEEESKPAAVTASDDLPSWMTDETGELVAEPTKIEPTRPTDWTPAEQEKVDEVEDSLPSPAPEPEPEPEPKPTPVPEAVKKPSSQKKEVKPEPYKEPVTRKTTGMLEMPVDPILGSARAELNRSNIPGALDTYGKLIKKGRFLEEVIYDLRDALYRYPVEVSIWQSLGDAYMRANQLQDALDAYTKAEELLR